MDLKRSRDGWDRWTCLAAAMVLEICGGLGYTFAVYSQHLKETMNYDQEDLDDIGAAKDFGYTIGIIGGILYNLIPPWLTVAFGSLLHFLGYFMVYSTSAGHVHPPLWILSSFFAVGVGGDSWIDGAAVMTSVQNFPDFRGTAIGLLKAQIGLSGAFFVMIYQGFLKPDVNAYVLLVAIVPPLASTALAVFIRPFEADGEQNVRTGERRFQMAYGATVTLGLCILVSIFVQVSMDVSHAVLVLFAVTMMMLFSLIIFLVALYNPMKKLLCSYKLARADYTNSEEMVVNPRLKAKSSDLNLGEDHHLLQGETQDSQVDSRDLAASTPSQTVPYQGYQFLDPPTEETKIDGSTGMEVERKKEELDGAIDMTRDSLLQCVQRLDFWLLCFVAITGPGSGLAIINNFGQIGRSLEAHNVELFVGVISIANCFGRLIAGYGSDLVMKMKYPRPLCLSVSHITMAIGCVTLSIGYVPLLYVGAALVGSSYGSVWALAPAIISEVFGLNNFAALYKLVGTCGPVGAYILSAKIVGQFYDEEAEVYMAHATTWDDDDVQTCLGRKCFGSSILVLAMVCLMGASLGSILAFRTRHIYARINN